MQGRNVEAGKQWGEQTVRELEREVGISIDLQWGPVWPAPPIKRRAKAPTLLQLILSRGKARKIVWLDTDDLTSAISDVPEQSAARYRIRSRVSGAIATVAEQP